MIFTSGTLLITIRWRFAPSTEISWIFVRKLLGCTQNPENERLSERFASWKRSKRCAKMMKSMKIVENRRWEVDLHCTTLYYSTVTLGTVTLGTVLNILEANVVYLDLCPSSSSYPSSNPCTFQQNIFYADSEPEPVPGLELVLGFISSQHIYQFVV